MTGILPDTSLQGFEALDEVNPTYSLSRNILSDSHDASQSTIFYILVAILLTRFLTDCLFRRRCTYSLRDVVGVLVSLSIHGVCFAVSVERA
jgi:hypothetical protein